MTKDEFIQYWIPARRFETLKNGTEASQQLATRLGYPYPKAGSWNQIPLTAELKGRLTALAGPYRETLLKIAQIKREYNAQKRGTHLPQTKQDDRSPKAGTGVDPS